MIDGYEKCRVCDMIDMVAPEGIEFDSLMAVFQHYVTQLGYPHRLLTSDELKAWATMDCDDEAAEERNNELHTLWCRDMALLAAYEAWVESLQVELSICLAGDIWWSVVEEGGLNAGVHMSGADWKRLTPDEFREARDYMRAIAPETVRDAMEWYAK